MPHYKNNMHHYKNNILGVFVNPHVIQSIDPSIHPFNIEKAFENLGPKQADCYWRFAVIAGTERTRIILYFSLKFFITSKAYRFV